MHCWRGSAHHSLLGRGWEVCDPQRVGFWAQAAVLRRWRRDPRSSCGAGWSPFIWLLERIGASSARPVAQEYLAPYHMKVGSAGQGRRAACCSFAAAAPST